MTHTNHELTIPYLSVGDLGWKLMRLDGEDYDRHRNELVDRVFDANHVSRDLVPDAWAGSPLTRWCWLIVHLNELDYDPLVHHPLTHWGIDLSFAGEDLRQFIWAVA